MEEEDWVRVLEVLYDDLDTVERYEGSTWQTEIREKLEENTSMNGEEILQILLKLGHLGLVEISASATKEEEEVDFEDLGFYGGLTPDGFQVIHDRLLMEQQERLTNQVRKLTLLIGLLTFLLVVFELYRIL